MRDGEEGWRKGMEKCDERSGMDKSKEGCRKRDEG